MDLDIIRKEIDKIDTKITESFSKRMDIVKKVAKYKIDNDMPILDTDREKRVVEKASKKVRPEYRQYVSQVYATLMAVSRDMQKNIIAENSPDQKTNIDSAVGFLGPIGSYSMQALFDNFNPEKAVPKSTFNELFLGLDKEYSHIIVPVENTLTGSVNGVVDLMNTNTVFIEQEYIISVSHNLLSTSYDINTIKTVISHPQALEQCKQYLETLGVNCVASSSTAQAAKTISEKNDDSIGVIASEAAQKLYNLNKLAGNISNDYHNYTRFLLLSKTEIYNPEADKISLIAILNHKPGSLYAFLKEFEKLNLLKIESRPVIGSPWEYRFHVDIEGNIKDKEIQKALENAKQYAANIKYLGNYKSSGRK